MANVNGAWDVSIKAPTGDQKGTLDLASSGDNLTGTFSANGDKVEITDGKISGDTLSWTMKVTKPMPLSLKAEAKLENDALSGSVAIGVFGSFPLVGTRA
jgi:hypothetical protein